ncbi:MAG: NUDIX domain-containing protein [Proteobacteria bacterium]|nr:NUDIX domain-containing protein [Pseudomonadota bacterium]
MAGGRQVYVRLNAVILAVSDERPLLLTVAAGDEPVAALPAGVLDAESDRTLELALRRLVREQAGLELGYVEQLYTFGDRGRDPRERVLSVAYLALVGEGRGAPPPAAAELAAWRDGYALFPWEDWREARPAGLAALIEPALRAWAGADGERQARAAIYFGLGGSAWDPTRVLERYELLYELGLVAESARDRRGGASALLGQPMALDHRRMVATALGRMRGKLSYRPVVFELLPEAFTLSRLQRVVEALAGMRLHTPNFRRLIERGGLVERTGVLATRSVGRPAELYRFRREVLRERPAPGVGLPRGV